MLDMLESTPAAPPPQACALQQAAPLEMGADQRRVRFSSIDGLERSDLPLACEVWREDILAAPWANTTVFKLATHLTRYICHPNPTAMGLREIEGQCRLPKEEVDKALSLMRSNGAIDSFSIERDVVRVATHLSLLQRLRVLEARVRLEALAGRPVQLRDSPATPIAGHPLPGMPLLPVVPGEPPTDELTGR